MAIDTPLRTVVVEESPLTELLDYLNDHMALLGCGTGEPMFSAQSAVLHQRGTRLEARVGPFVLHSEERIVRSRTGAAPTQGYLPRVRVHLPSGREVAPDLLFRLQISASAVVAMDRLCRILHMLQHLALGREGHDLWLHVSARHLLSVQEAHGAFFEQLLRRCGLGPDRIVLILPALGAGTDGFDRYLVAATNYRERGYRLALDLREPCVEAVRAAARELAPDWLRLHARDAHLVEDVVPGAGRLLRGSGGVPVSGGVAIWWEAAPRGTPLFSI